MTGAAVFETLARCYLRASRGISGPGTVAGELPGLVYGAAGTPIAGLNRVMPLVMPEPVEDGIDAVEAVLGAYPVVSWWIAPSTRPDDLPARLLRRGFSEGRERPPAMWVDLASLPTAPRPPGFSISVADAAAEIRIGNEIVAAAFGAPPSMAELLDPIFVRLLDDPDGAGRVFIGRLDDAPVSTALTWIDGDVVVIYNVGTVAAARGRGLGGAITRAALEDARGRGASIGVLESSEIGHSVYARLGFADAGEYRVLLRGS